METRAHHILIGFFTLLTISAALLFTLWLGKSSFDNSYDNYEVVFKEAVTGLSTGSPVQFNGIKVGEVTNLRLDLTDPSKVLATIRVNASTPVRQDTQAKLSLAGITGTSFIQLSSGEVNSPPLAKRRGQLPQIIAEPSSISRLLSDGNGMIGKVNDLLSNANRLFSVENSENISKILHNLEQTTGAIAADREALHILFAELQQLSKQANQSMAQANQLLTTGNQLLDRHGEATLSSLQATLSALQRSSATVEQLLSQNSGALDQGLHSLGELQPAMQELRQTLNNLRTISQRIEANPAGYLLGREPREEFQP